MRFRRTVAELFVLVFGSGAVGWIIGTLQHYVSFGVWGYGISREAFWLACFEGGEAGVIIAVPTGLMVYCQVLKKSVTARESGVIAIASLFAGCLLGVLFFWPSAFLTPIVTIGVASWLRRRTASSSAIRG